MYAYVGNDPINVVDPSGLCGTRIKGRTAVGCKSYILKPDQVSNSLSVNQSAHSESSSPSTSPDFLNDKHVNNELDRAWQDSNPYSKDVQRGEPSSRKWETGGWIIQNRWTGKYSVTRANAGTRDSLPAMSNSKPSWSLLTKPVGWFHTHPNKASEGYKIGPSTGDINFTKRYAEVPGVVVTHQGIIVIPFP